LETLCSLTGASIKCHAVKTPRGAKLEKVSGFWLHTMTVVFPWAVDLLKQNPQCAMTDSTFRSCKPYTLAILHLIFANESIPIRFAISPSETAKSYIKLYDHINEEIKIVEGGKQGEVQVDTADGNQPWVLSAETEEAAVEEEDWGELAEPEEPEPSPAAGTAPLAPTAEASSGDAEPAVAAVEALLAEASSDDPSPEEPRRSSARLEEPRTLLTKLPIVTDQGTALQAFVGHFNLEWKLCHRHIIESIGAKGRLTDYVCRILRCFSPEQYAATCETINEEMKGKEEALKDMDGYQSLMRWLGKLHDNHPLAAIEHWALWLRLRCPRTTNSAEAVNGRLNKEKLNQKDFVDRVFGVGKHFLTRYNSRFTWRDRALTRNRFKCWPDNPQSPDCSSAKTHFYRALHRVSDGATLPARKEAPCPLLKNPGSFLGSRVRIFVREKYDLPPSWEIENRDAGW
jgi:hypothetical protein